MSNLLPRSRFRRRVVRDLIRCAQAKTNPTRRLCHDAAFVIATLEVTLQGARKK